MPKKRIASAILITLKRHGGKFQGTRRLAEKINAGDHITRVMSYCRLLESKGAITISRSKGGRGNRTEFTFALRER